MGFVEAVLFWVAKQVAEFLVGVVLIAALVGLMLWMSK